MVMKRSLVEVRFPDGKKIDKTKKKEPVKYSLG